MGVRYYLYLRSTSWLVLFSLSHGFTFKKIIGYHFSKQMTLDIVVQALTKDYASQRHLGEVILHTDLGLPYTSKELKDLTSRLNHSMPR